VTADARAHVNDVLPDFVRRFLQLLRLEAAQIRGRIDLLNETHRVGL
jgi:hypothetical protein